MRWVLMQFLDNVGGVLFSALLCSMMLMIVSISIKNTFANEQRSMTVGGGKLPKDHRGEYGWHRGRRSTRIFGAACLRERN